MSAPYVPTPPPVPAPVRMVATSLSAWESVPKAVRFAVWMWAVYVIALTVAAAAAAVVWVVFLLVTLGSM